MAGSENGLDTLQQTIRDPQTAERLLRVLARLETIEQTLELAESAAHVAPHLLATMADVADETASRLQEKGIDIDERLHLLLGLAEKATEPSNLQALDSLIDRLERVAQLTAVLDELPNLLSMFVDTVDEAYKSAEAVGIDIDSRVRSTFLLGDRLTAPDTVDALGNVLDSRAVTIVGMIGQTLAECREECMNQPEPYRLTLMRFLRESRDPDFQRALGFLASFAKMFGKNMNEMHRQFAQNSHQQKNESA